MNFNENNCGYCRQHSDVGSVSEEFYRGFFLRRHQRYEPNLQSVVCARLAEGGDEEALDKIRIYADQRSRNYVNNGNCECHPHERTVSIGNYGKGAWEEEFLLREAIDSFWAKIG